MTLTRRTWIVLVGSLVGLTGSAAAQPGPRHGDDPHVSAVLVSRLEHNFTRWFERISGQGSDGVFVDGSDDDRRRRRLPWDQVGPLVTQFVDVDVALPGRLFVVATFSMDNKAEYKLTDRLHSVGGLYPQVSERGTWKDLGVGDSGFNITEMLGASERASVRHFSYRGQPGDRQLRVLGKGLVVQPGKYRLQVMSAMAKDWAAWFPATANVFVYFAPSLPPPPAAVAELAIPAVSRPAGSTVSVPITLKNADRLGDMNVTIDYPARLVQLESIDRGTMITAGTQFTTDVNRAAGRIGVALASRTGLSGDGELAVLRFKVIGNPGQREAVAIKVTSAHRADDQPATIRSVDSQVAVLGMLGDGDGDGRITSRDALMALQLSVRQDGAHYNAALDIDGDGQITARDARWLLQLAVGIRPPGYAGPIGDEAP